MPPSDSHFIINLSAALQADEIGGIQRFMIEVLKIIA